MLYLISFVAVGVIAVGFEYLRRKDRHDLTEKKKKYPFLFANAARLKNREKGID